MNKYIRNITFVSALSLWAMSTTSCTDYLDKAPASDINPTDAYTNFRSFQGFTEELYNCVPVITGNTSHNSWNWGEDVYWIPNDTRPFAYRIDQGDYWAWNSCEYGWLKDGGKPETGTRGDKGRLWGLSWYGIRKANIGIANLDKLTDATQEEKTLSKVNSTFSWMVSFYANAVLGWFALHRRGDSIGCRVPYGTFELSANG